MTPFEVRVEETETPGLFDVHLSWAAGSGEPTFELTGDGVEIEADEIVPVEPEGGMTRVLLHQGGRDSDRLVEAAMAWGAQMRPGESAVFGCGPWTSEVTGSQDYGSILEDVVARGPCRVPEQPAPPGSSRTLVIASELPPLPPPTIGPVHLVLLAGEPDDRWREATRRSGGRILQVAPSTRAALGVLRRAEATRATARIRACGAGSLRVHRREPSPTVVEVPLSSPPCAPVVPPATSGLPSWIWPVTGVMAALSAVAGVVWARRSRPGVPPLPVVAAAPPATGWRIKVLRGDHLPPEVPWTGTTLTIGSGTGNDLRIQGTGISSRHARLERFPSGVVFVTDADSANGTWVAGSRLERGERRLLRPGEPLALGQDVELELVPAEGRPSGGGRP